MTRGKPPLPTIVRPVFWVLRTFGVLVLLSGLYGALLAVMQGEWAVAGYLAAVGVGFAALTWIHPLSPWFAALLAGLGVVTALATQSWLSAVFFVGLAALLVWWPRRSRARFIGSKPEQISVAAPDAVMRNAQRFIDGFEAAGFERVGAIQIPIGPMKVIESVLLSSDGLAYAGVTDAIVHVTSLFPGGRSLVTRNNELGHQPPYVLLDSVPGGSPSDLIESHAKALDLVAERDHYPLPLSRPELVDIAIESERASLKWAGSNRDRRPAAASRGSLSRRLGRYEQIDTWHGSAAADDA